MQENQQPEETATSEAGFSPDNIGDLKSISVIYSKEKTGPAGVNIYGFEAADVIDLLKHTIECLENHEIIINKII